ncbi:MAG: recombinase family protein [Rhodospirillaceae bacterium]
MNPPIPKIRCAVYTRKSSEEGLEQEFNSLDAQREACEAYIVSQRHEGWLAVPDRYDDGGISGGTMKRPALQRLIADIEAGRIDTIVVYKVDRLSRSLTDFAKLVDLFETHGVTFVSVTQQFNTTTSMGRLTLNMLLSFAQFEREVIGERIRDKFAASRRRGMWMGGWAPLGYDVRDRKLAVNAAEAKLVRRIFDRFVVLGSMTRLVRELGDEGLTTKDRVKQDGTRMPGRAFDKGAIYKLLRNRVYIGDAVHKGTAYPGEHDAILDRALWDKVQAILASAPKTRANNSRAQHPALLKGLIYGPGGRAMTPTHTRKKGKLYRYYVTAQALKTGYGDCPVGCVPAGEVEGAVIAQVRALVTTPEMVAGVWDTLRKQAGPRRIPETEVLEALRSFDALWDTLFPAEQARIVQLLVERVSVATDGIEVRLRIAGLGSLVDELRAGRPEQQDAT